MLYRRGQHVYSTDDNAACCTGEDITCKVKITMQHTVQERTARDAVKITLHHVCRREQHVVQ